ncbi:MAG: type I glyceraldehyde-3-phosphate dehydrogenase, partial [Planctomycetota bacterium]
AINDIGPLESLFYLLKYDTIMGKFDKDIRLQGRELHWEGKVTLCLQERELNQLPWKDLNLDFVIESTGLFRKRKEIERHLEAGAPKVILTVPAKDEIDATVVMGVNDDTLKKEDRIISNASCTTNCLAPLAKVIQENFGIQKGYMTTIHAYTNDQRLADVPHKDLRRSRAASENIIPTTTGAAKAVGKVLPVLKGKLDGIAVRVPVPDGSVVDLTVELERDATSEAVNQAVFEASKGSLAGILEYSTEPIVSSDIIGNPHSSIFDSLCTKMVGSRFLKVVSWYDNEWGYSNRVVDLMEKVYSL